MPQKNVRFSDNPGMMFDISFVIVAILNAIVIALAGAWFPNSIVMGTVDMTSTWAIILFGSVLSLATVLFLPFMTVIEKNLKRELKPMEMMIIYFVFNFISIWLITRKSEIFGVGVTSWMVVLWLALVLDIVQGVVMMQVEKWRNS